MTLELRPLTLERFDDFAALTCDEGGGGCFCSFWHESHLPMVAWKARCRDAPETNRALVRRRVEEGRHVGVLAYDEGALAAWISVGPLPDFVWTAPREAELGAAAATTAAILCLTVAPERRRQGLQRQLLEALLPYAAGERWQVLEGYPFDDAARAAHGTELDWPGTVAPFAEAGFVRVSAHWKNHPGYERWIYRRATSQRW